MALKSVTIDGSAVRDIEHLFEILGDRINYPSHWGRNSDALYDFLTSGDLHKPVEIRIGNEHALRDSLGKDRFSQIVKACQLAVEWHENNGFSGQFSFRFD